MFYTYLFPSPKLNASGGISITLFTIVIAHGAAGVENFGLKGVIWLVHHYTSSTYDLFVACNYATVADFWGLFLTVSWSLL